MATTQQSFQLLKVQRGRFAKIRSGSKVRFFNRVKAKMCTDIREQPDSLTRKFVCENGVSRSSCLRHAAGSSSPFFLSGLDITEFSTVFDIDSIRKFSDPDNYERH